MTTDPTPLDVASFVADCERLADEIGKAGMEHPDGRPIRRPSRWIAAIRRDPVGYSRRVLDRPVTWDETLVPIVWNGREDLTHEALIAAPRNRRMFTETEQARARERLDEARALVAQLTS